MLGIYDSFGLRSSTQWIPDCRYWIQDSLSMLIRLDSNREWGLGSLQLRSGFHQQKFPGLWIPQAQIFRITESGFPYVCR